jgi:hypothetical protein
MEITYKFDHGVAFIFIFLLFIFIFNFHQKIVHEDTFQRYLMFHLSIKFDKICTKIII